MGIDIQKPKEVKEGMYRKVVQPKEQVLIGQEREKRTILYSPFFFAIKKTAVFQSSLYVFVFSCYISKKLMLR